MEEGFVREGATHTTQGVGEFLIGSEAYVRVARNFDGPQATITSTGFVKYLDWTGRMLLR